MPSTSQLDEADEQALDRIADLLRPLDVVSTSLDGVREQLLGISYESGMVVRTRDADGDAKPPATGLPVPLFGGALTVEALRVVDAFGRTLDLPVDSLARLGQDPEQEKIDRRRDQESDEIPCRT